MVPRTTLLTPIHTLLSALSQPPTTITYISTLLSAFTTSPTPLIHEHGLPQLAPFLGRSFTGPDGLSRYFALLTEHLTISELAFEPDEAWLVDDAAMAAVLRGKAKFTWNATGQGWNETFVYRIALATEVDEEAGGKGVLKVVEYRVWADTGACYLARCGRLGDLMGERGGVEGIYFADGTGDREMEARKMEGRETRGSLSRKRSGQQDVLGSGLSVYGSCG